MFMWSKSISELLFPILQHKPTSYQLVSPLHGECISYRDGFTHINLRNKMSSTRGRFTTIPLCRIPIVNSHHALFFSFLLNLHFFPQKHFLFYFTLSVGRFSTCLIYTYPPFQLTITHHSKWSNNLKRNILSIIFTYTPFFTTVSSLTRALLTYSILLTINTPIGLSV